MRYWSITLHFYQPPTQSAEITQQVLESCYLPLLKMLLGKQGYGLTLNLSGSLLFQLRRLNANRFFEMVKQLVSEGKVELTTSALYHPLMTITPVDVLKRQIKKNSEMLEEIFEVKSTVGFFPPELAVNKSSLELMPVKYVFVDESALTSSVKGHSIARYNDKLLLINSHDVCAIFRAYPTILKASVVLDVVKNNCGEGELLVSVNDAELFGHHYSERLQVLSDLLDSKEVQLITASAAVSRFGSSADIVNNIRPSTWQEGKRFELWSKNKLQKKYLAMLQAVHDFIAGSTNATAQDYLDQAYSSCYLYWLSNWPWWHPGLVEKGVQNLVRSIAIAEGEDRKKIAIEELCRSFSNEMWEFHESGKVEKNYRRFEKERN
ncbi:MAG: hypothetical protein WC775_02365 [Patescibacteria group bacterium]|jgi:alpha-amylase/alpha-mannosidase (GH57 family)